MYPVMYATRSPRTTKSNSTLVLVGCVYLSHAPLVGRVQHTFGAELTRCAMLARLVLPGTTIVVEMNTHETKTINLPFTARHKYIPG